MCLRPCSWEGNVNPVWAEPKACLIYRSGCRRTERDLAEQRSKISNLTASRRCHSMMWLMWMILADTFLKFFKQQRSLCDLFVWFFQMCLRCCNKREQRSLSSCSYCSIEERVFLSEEKQSLCCFCKVSRFQIRCRSGGNKCNQLAAQKMPSVSLPPAGRQTALLAQQSLQPDAHVDHGQITLSPLGHAAQVRGHNLRQSEATL